MSGSSIPRLIVATCIRRKAATKRKTECLAPRARLSKFRFASCLRARIGLMSIDTIKEAIAGLPADDKAALTSWLIEQEMDDWDRKMQQDFSPGGRGAALVQKVKDDIQAGKFAPMDAVPRTKR